MGFIDAIYILDQTQFPILHYKLNPSVPSFDYIRSQLLNAKRELLTKSGLDITDHGLAGTYIFDSKVSSLGAPSSGGNELVTLDPVLKLDSDWLVAWCKTDSLYLLAIGTSPQEYLDVVSDDEEDTDEDDQIEDEAQAESESEIHTPKQQGSDRQPLNHDEYSALSASSTDNSEAEYEPETPSNLNRDTHSEPEAAVPTTEVAQTAEEKEIPNSPNPMQYITFLDVFAQAVKITLQTKTLSPHKIQINSHRIIMMLQELLDASVPFISDMNQLRELLPNDSIIEKLVSATKHIQNTAASSISNIKNGSMPNVRNDPTSAPPAFTYSTILERSGNQTPWRKANMKTAQNEIFLDLYESIDLIISPKNYKNSRSSKTSNTFSSFSSYNASAFSDESVAFTKAVIHGHLDLTTSLIGNPLLDIHLNVPSSLSLDNCYPALHRAIDRNVWVNSSGKSIQLTPPDESSKLLTYHIDLIEQQNEQDDNLEISKFCGSVAVELHSGLGIGRNEFEVVVNTGCGLNSGFGSNESNVKDIEDLCVEIFLPESACLDVGSDAKSEVRSRAGPSGGNDGSNNNLISGETGGYGANRTRSEGSDTGLYDLKVLRSSTGTVTKAENGSYQWKLDSDVVVGGKFTLRGSIDSSVIEEQEGDGLERQGGGGARNPDSFPPQPRKPPRRDVAPRFLNVHYKHHGSVPSGIKIQSIKVVSGGANVKPFKGVKYTAKSGNYIVR